MLDLAERENEIIRMLEKLSQAGLPFSVIGGYGVSAYRHRFSIDADIVIRKEDKERFEAVLRENGYRKTVHSSEFERFEKSEPKACVDLLIGGLGVRQTGAAFGFDFIFENSERREIQGSEKSVEASVPTKEVLIILKLHSGRLTDLRDVAALSFELDFEFIRKHLFRGNIKLLKESMKKLESLIEKTDFQDSFKGVFMEKSYRIDIDKIQRLVTIQP